jgi:hypothetical protein
MILAGTGHRTHPGRRDVGTFGAGQPRVGIERHSGRTRREVRSVEGGHEVVRWTWVSGRPNLRRRMLPVVAISGLAIASTAVGPGPVSAMPLRGPAPVAGAAESTTTTIVHTPLCDSAGSVTLLVVRRTVAFPQNHFRFSFPYSVRVRRASAARKVARALCALPVLPRGAFSCPADFGILYHLQLARDRQRFRVVTIEATGCEAVQGLATARWVARSPKFWRTLGVAMGIRQPAWETFRGRQSAG